MRNRVFFPQASLDQWGVEGKIELTSSELVMLGDGRRYEITEVVRVVREVTGSPDIHGIVGLVKSKSELEGIGAEILENSMVIGDNAYDVVPGWAGLATTSFAEYLASPVRARVPVAPPKTEEELIARFAEGTP